MKFHTRFFLAVLFILFLFPCPADDILIAEWDFTKGNINSVNQAIPMTLRGSTRIVSAPEGKYLSVGNTPEGKAQGVQSSKIHAELSPVGAFRVEVKFRLHAAACKNMYLRLFDTKNVNYNGKNPQWHKGFLLELVKTREENLYRPSMSLGFGNGESENCNGSFLTLLPEEIYTLGAEYNGKNAVTFTLDGRIIRIAPLKKEHGAIAPAVNRLVIGDRAGTPACPFNGDIFSVKLFRVTPSLEITANRRRAFFRNKTGERLMCVLSNPSDVTARDIVLKSSAFPLKSGEIRIPELAGGSRKKIFFPVETRLKKGKYPAEITLDYTLNGLKSRKTFKTELLICPEPKDIMPIEFEQATNSYYIPVTHVLRQLDTVYSKYNASKEMIENYYRELDDLMYKGYSVMDLCFIGKLPKYIKKYPRVDRSGKPRKTFNLDASHPEIRSITEEHIRKTAETFGEHPAFTGASINSEVRDRSLPSFAPHNAQAYKAYSGQEIPDAVDGKLAPHYLKLPSFPLSRLVKTGDPLLKYYSWYWKTGDGWNDYQTLIADTFRKGIKRPFDTEHHPAVRTPPLWGSGGKVSWINHWTYVNPDPPNIGVNTAEMQAMARGVPGQKVKTMTTMIVYRSVTAPKGGSANEPSWVKEFPDAHYITAPPDMIREALFVQLSRHVEAISFHGYDTLDRRKKSLAPSYKNTNPHTKVVLADFLNKVVLPFGPVLKRLPERNMELAVLESFASTIFANRGSWGSRGWVFDFQLMLQWANLPAKVIYEEEILRSGFGNIKVLFMPHCDVLPEKIFDAVTEFQRKGGIVITDQCHVPGLLPDAVIPVINRSGKPDEDKQKFQIAGKKLKEILRNYYTPYSDSSNMDMLTWIRSDKGSDYLFVINDKRTFGDYVGQYKKVMEKGLPNRGRVKIRRTCGVVYDLLEGKKIPFRTEKGSTLIDLQFKTNDGKILLLMDSPVQSLELQMPAEAQKGSVLPYTVRIKTADGQYLKALHPLKVEVRDSDGILTDDSSYAAMENGIYANTLTLPLNGKEGSWSITVRDPVSGILVQKKFQLR